MEMNTTEPTNSMVATNGTLISPLPETSSQLWIPYVLIGLSCMVFLAVHFWCYHRRNRERYLEKLEDNRVKNGLVERRRIVTLMGSPQIQSGGGMYARLGRAHASSKSDRAISGAESRQYQEMEDDSDSKTISPLTVVSTITSPSPPISVPLPSSIDNPQGSDTVTPQDNTKKRHSMQLGVGLDSTTLDPVSGEPRVARPLPQKQLRMIRPSGALRQPEYLSAVAFPYPVVGTQGAERFPDVYYTTLDSQPSPKSRKKKPSKRQAKTPTGNVDENLASDDDTKRLTQSGPYSISTTCQNAPGQGVYINNAQLSEPYLYSSTNPVAIQDCDQPPPGQSIDQDSQNVPSSTTKPPTGASALSTVPKKCPDVNSSSSDFVKEKFPRPVCLPLGTNPDAPSFESNVVQVCIEPRSEINDSTFPIIQSMGVNQGAPLSVAERDLSFTSEKETPSFDLVPETGRGDQTSTDDLGEPQALKLPTLRRLGSLSDPKIMSHHSKDKGTKGAGVSSVASTSPEDAPKKTMSQC